MRDKTKGIYILLPVIGIVILYMLQFITHRCVPFMMDDEWYITNLATGGELQSLGDVIEGQVWHYLNWGGRSITHGILQLTLMSGELCADILNVVMTLLLAYLICVVSEQKTLVSFLLSSSLLICFNANTKMSMFWQSGLVNYVYSSVWILAFLGLYIKVADNPECDNCLLSGRWGCILLSILMLPMGLMTGWSNENMGPTCFLLAMIVIVWRKIHQKAPIPFWMYVGAVASFAGSALCILAPGNFVRSAAIEPKSLGQTLTDRFFSMFEAGVGFLFPVIIVVIFLLIFYKIKLQGSLRTGQLLLLFGMVLSYGAMALSPHYPDRATFGTMVLGIVVINTLLAQIEEKIPRFRQYKSILLVSVWIYSLAVLVEIVMHTQG